MLTPSPTDGPGGGGAGGSILIRAQIATLGTNLIAATGGSSGSGETNPPVTDHGSVGRIRVEYCTSVSGGIADPPASVAQISCDSDGDGVPDATDNCPTVFNPGQENAVHPGTPAGDACENPDGDAWVDAADNCPDVGTAWFVPLDDNPDCDGFPATTQQGMRGPESFIGTDPNLACGTNAWPVDNNDDRSVGLADVLRYIPVYLTQAGDGHYNPRYDLNADSKIGLADILSFIPFYLTTCTP